MGLPDLGLIAGETVLFEAPSPGELLPNNERVPGWTEPVEVRNVLFSPSATSDTSRPEGDLERVVMGFPKGFDRPLAGARVTRADGRAYTVEGDPTRLTPENTPGPWDVRVTARRVDG